MSLTTTFPGIYIQELPSSTHTIAAAPTSVAVFIGYSHPFKTKHPGVPVELFSLSDYEREFGGLAHGTLSDNTLAYAVSQFFLNGGGDAVVVGLVPATYYDHATSPPTPRGDVKAGSVPLAGGHIVLTAREPTDPTKMVVGISNVGSPNTVADITVVYGAQQEVHRKVSLDSANDNPDFLERRINDSSTLVRVSPGAGSYPTTFTQAETGTINEPVPHNADGLLSVADFTKVFQTDGPLDKWPIFNLLMTPGITDEGLLSEALAFCERRLAFFIMDPPRTAISDAVVDPALNPGGTTLGAFAHPSSPNGALYFPYLQSSDPSTGTAVTVPPSGTVAGIFARTDTARGVWKAPAGLETTILNTSGVVPSGLMTDARQGVLNNGAINCLRTFPGVGTVVFGARTLAYTNTALRTQWGYVPVRRMALFLEQTLKANLTWVIFEPNDEPLWVAIRTTIESFMLSLFHQGAFAGSKPGDSFQVKCDSSTTTPEDVNNGRVNIIVAFAPLKPAEFVIIKIAQLAGQAQV